MGKILKKVASVALPIAGGVFGGPLGAAAASALTTKLINHGSWGDTLKSGLLSGALAGIGGGLSDGLAPSTGIGFIDSLNKGIISGLSPVSGALSSIGSGLSGAAGSIQDYLGLPSISGALSGVVPSGAAQTLGVNTANDAALAGSANLQGIMDGTSSVASSGAGRSILSGLTSKLAENPLGALGAALTIGNAMQGPPEGTQSQEQILAQMQADKAQKQQFSDETIRQLNAATSGRAPVAPAISDYYSYGTRPEATFFDKVNTPITYGSGALS